MAVQNFMNETKVHSIPRTYEQCYRMSSCLSKALSHKLYKKTVISFKFILFNDIFNSMCIFNFLELKIYFFKFYLRIIKCLQLK